MIRCIGRIEMPETSAENQRKKNKGDAGRYATHTELPGKRAGFHDGCI
jgi:hypothetical protein